MLSCNVLALLLVASALQQTVFAFSSDSSSSGTDSSSSGSNSDTDLSPETLNIRKNILHLTAAEKKQFIDAIKFLKLEKHASPAADNSSGIEYSTYDYIAWEHNTGASYHAIHANARLLPWHRAYLIKFERELQRVSGNSSLAMPYWDFTDPWTRDAVFDDTLFGGNSTHDDFRIDSGPFATTEPGWDTGLCKLHIGTGVHYTAKRCLGCRANAHLPPLCAWAEALSISEYTSSPYYEDSNCDYRLSNFNTKFHSLIHAFVQPLNEVKNCYPVNDPLFWVIHSFLDKFYALWQDIQHSSDDSWGYQPLDPDYLGESGLLLNHTLYGTGFSTGDIIDPNSLPYVYESDDQFDKLADSVRANKTACEMSSSPDSSDFCYGTYHKCPTTCEAILPGRAEPAYGDVGFHPSTYKNFSIIDDDSSSSSSWGGSESGGTTTTSEVSLKQALDARSKLRNNRHEKSKRKKRQKAEITVKSKKTQTTA